MEQVSTQWLDGEALVTYAGLMFGARFYTCRTAMREQWFMKAMSGGWWKVQIRYRQTEPELIHIVIPDQGEAEKEPTLCVGREVSRGSDVRGDIEVYYRQLQQLKQRRRGRAGRE